MSQKQMTFNPFGMLNCPDVSINNEALNDTKGVSETDDNFNPLILLNCPDVSINNQALNDTKVVSETDDKPNMSTHGAEEEEQTIICAPEIKLEYLESPSKHKEDENKEVPIYGYYTEKKKRGRKPGVPNKTPKPKKEEKSQKKNPKLNDLTAKIVIEMNEDLISSIDTNREETNGDALIEKHRLKKAYVVLKKVEETNSDAYYNTVINNENSDNMKTRRGRPKKNSTPSGFPKTKRRRITSSDDDIPIRKSQKKGIIVHTSTGSPKTKKRRITSSDDDIPIRKRQKKGIIFQTSTGSPKTKKKRLLQLMMTFPLEKDQRKGSQFKHQRRKSQKT